MISSDQAKSMAKKLRAALEAEDVQIPHAMALELVAASLGFADWNTATAMLERAASDAIKFIACNPVIRIFDEAKAREFYCDFLGFSVAFEHRFADSMPLYMAVERGGIATASVRTSWRCQPGFKFLYSDDKRTRFPPRAVGQAICVQPPRARTDALGTSDASERSLRQPFEVLRTVIQSGHELALGGAR